jgi:hypothetical protein
MSNTTDAIDRTAPIFKENTTELLECLLRTLKTIETSMVALAFEQLCAKNPTVQQSSIIHEIIAGNATWTLLLFVELASQIIENDAHVNHAYVFRGTQALSSSTQLL